MTPATDPLSWQITEAVKDLLAGISTGADYWYTYQNVELRPQGAGDTSAVPTIKVYPTGGRYRNPTQTDWTQVLRLEIDVLHNHDPSEPDQPATLAELVARMKHDVEKRLMSDDTLGGLANEVQFISWEELGPEEGEEGSGLNLVVEVLYQHLRTDPASQAVP